MANDEAFIRAIRDRPDDDLPRLIYADWLDEQGEATRAEFIRLQIELARMPENDRGRKRLETRARALHETHGENWHASLTAYRAVGQYERGLIEFVWMQGDDFARFAPDLLAEFPVRRLLFRDAWEDIRAIADCPRLAEIREVSFERNRMGADEVAAFAASPHLDRLEWLDLSRNRFHSPAVEALADANGLRSLRTLDLSHTNVGSVGLEALARSRSLPNLHTLKLRHANIGPIGIEALGRGNAPPLRELDLYGNELGTRGIRALIAGEHFRTLDRLELGLSDVPAGWHTSLAQRFGSVLRLLV